MTLFLVILLILVVALFFVLGSVLPRNANLSQFERNRLLERGDTLGSIDEQRHTYYVFISNFRTITLLLLLFFVFILSILSLGWVWGVTVTIIVIVAYPRMSQLSFIQGRAQSWYDRNEDKLFDTILKVPSFIVAFLSKRSRTVEETSVSIHSRSELLHIISQTHHLTSSEKTVVKQGIDFPKKHVKQHMTKRSQLVSIDKDELLGPLVLNDLHKTGHTRFPVIDGDVDHIIGYLRVDKLMSLDNKRSEIAERAMDPRVSYVHEKQPLHEALAMIVTTHQDILVVINSEQQTVGLITLSDIMTALFGAELTHVYDDDDVLTRVSQR